ncbi:MAG TPA: hypothetical protein VLW49_12580 [Gaiellaceae bacterium]|nr:hypothetical protein [Gaiellaceae bacterium]
MTTFDDHDTELDFFEEPETEEAPRRPPRRVGGPRRPGGPPSGGVAVVRLAAFVALAIAVVVGFVFWVGACQGKSKHAEYGSYMDAVRPLAQGSARVGAAFASALGSSSLKLATLEAKLTAWSQQEQRDYTKAEEIQPPGPLQSVHQQLLGTFQLRALGLAGLVNVLEQSKSASSATVGARLAGQAQLFGSSDIVYTELFRQPAMQELKSLGVTDVIVPTSQFVANPEVISSSSFAIVFQRLAPASSSSGGKVTGLHGSELLSTAIDAAGQTTTLATGTTTPVVLTQGLAVHVTFEDSGNFAEGNIPVTLAIGVGGTTVSSQKKTVTSISPKEQATVIFKNLQVPNSAFGHSASITVTVGKVPGEANLSNNTATYPVLFSLAQG